MRTYPGALFLAPPRYHHRLAANIWGGERVPVAGPETAGIDAYEIIVEDPLARGALLDRLSRAGLLARPQPDADGASRAADPTCGAEVVVRRPY